MNEALSNALDVMQARVDESIEALIERGSSISTDSGLVHLPQAIRELPTSDTSISFYQDDTEAYIKAIPRGAQTYSNLISVGGKTRKVPGVNLLTFASKGGFKDTLRVNYQEESYPQLIPAGSYRLLMDVKQDITDDCVTVAFGAVVNGSGSGSLEEVHIVDGFFTITEPKYVVPWVGCFDYNGVPEITVKKNFNDTIPLDTINTITIGGASADGTPDFGYISIDTNTRVKISLSHPFTGYEDKEMILGKGSYEFYWENGAVGEDMIVTIKVEQATSYPLPVTIYPMVYAVPDNSAEHILTEYVPYYERLVPTAVTEIVSKGKNLYDANNIIVGSFNSDGSFLKMPHLVRTETLIPIVGGKAYTLSCDPTYDLRFVYFYDSNEAYISNIRMNRPQNHYYTFTTPSEAAFVHISFELDGMTSGNADVEAAKANSKLQLELGSVATEYKPYWSETVAIPDAVKNDKGWGGSITLNNTTYRNTYYFGAKKYAKEVSEIYHLDGVTYKVSKSAQDSNTKNWYADVTIGVVDEYKGYSYGAFSNFICSTASTYGTAMILWSNDGLRARMFISADINTVEKAEEWLKNNPTYMQYVLKHISITTIDSDTPNPFLFKTEAEGEIVFENTDKEAVPSTVQYLIDIGEAQL